MKCVELIFALREEEKKKERKRERKIEVTSEQTTTIDNLISVDWLKKEEEKLLISGERGRRKKDIVPYVTNSILFVVVVTNQLDVCQSSTMLALSYFNGLKSRTHKQFYDLKKEQQVSLLTYIFFKGNMNVFITCPWLDKMNY